MLIWRFLVELSRYLFTDQSSYFTKFVSYLVPNIISFSDHTVWPTVTSCHSFWKLIKGKSYIYKDIRWALLDQTSGSCSIASCFTQWLTSYCQEPRTGHRGLSRILLPGTSIQNFTASDYRDLLQSPWSVFHDVFLRFPFPGCKNSNKGHSIQ